MEGGFSLVGILPNHASELCLIAAVCIEQDDERTASARRHLSEGSMALLAMKGGAAAPMASNEHSRRDRRTLRMLLSK